MYDWIQVNAMQEAQRAEIRARRLEADAKRLEAKADAEVDIPPTAVEHPLFPTSE